MNISKRTAERMLQNIEMRLQLLAAEQQSMNGNKGGKRMSKGGKVKLPGGGFTYGDSWSKPNTLFQDKYKTNFGINPLSNIPDWRMAQPPVSNWKMDTSNLPINIPTQTAPIKAVSDENLAIHKVATDNLKIPTLSNTATPSLANTNNPILNKKAGINWNNLMGMAPTIFNTIAGITAPKADVINPNAYQNPYESQAFSLMPDQFRIDDILNENRNAYGSYLKNVNSTGNSRGERMANYTSGMNRMNEANTKAYALKNNMENEMLTNKAQLRNNQGMFRAQTNLKVRDMNDANRDASINNRMAYLGAAASGMQNYGLTNKQMANQSASQQAYIDALMKFPHFTEWLGLDKLKVKGN